MNAQRKDQEGMALILSLIVLVALGIMLLGVVDSTRSQSNHVAKFVEYEQNLQTLESGIALARLELSGGITNDEKADGLIGVDPGFDFSSGNPSFDSEGVTPITLEAYPDVEFFAYSFDWSSDGVDNNGDGGIDEEDEDDYYSMYSSAKGPNSLRRVEMIFQGGNINVWSNAIFAGTGAAGNLINGNVSIHGSVHLLGDNLSPGDLAVAAIDLSGTSMIHNNYQGLAAALKARVPALPTKEFEGDTVETLNAKLRVKNGLVGMSGNSEVGEPQVAGNGWKETMDGVFQNDGWTGNSIDANGDPKNVYSDNGWDEAYDVGSAVPFPTFANDNGRDHLAYYLETSPPNTGMQFVHSGNIAVTANKHYYWNATTGTEILNKAPGVGGMPNVADLNPNEYYMWFDADNNQMYVNGRIPVDGNISIDRGGGSDGTINYTGKGTFLAYDKDASGDGGDVALEVDLLSVNANGTTAGSFPTNNLIGFQAEDDMTLGINSQLSLMGGFYAQDQITLNKQSTIMGTIVGNLFNMGGQVPDIYQVPELMNEWTTVMRMIGADEVPFLSPISWRELGV